jgi:competence protein ComEC
LSAVADLTIDFWDVGQADCSVITLPDGRLILIDVGKRGSPVVDWLAERRPAPRIAAIVLTHNHADHAGAMPAIVANNQSHIGGVWMLQDRPMNDPMFAKVFRSVDEAEAKGYFQVRRLENGQEIWRDDESMLRLHVLFPTFTSNVKHMGYPNQTSGLIVLDHGDKRLCAWPGDLPLLTVADQLRTKHPELLHGPHHGGPEDFKTNKAKSRQAVRDLSPRMSFISVGTTNSYSHPKPGYLGLLAASRCHVVCSQITNACDRWHFKNDTPVFDGSAALGLRSSRSGSPCRGAWRVTIKDGELIPDRFTGEHARRVAELKRPQCLRGLGWRRGEPSPWVREPTDE